MRAQIITMLEMQDRMNAVVHPQWVSQRYEWYRAVWIECAELLDHYGYKWWKKQSPEVEQVRLEIIDIWHFGMSALFADERSIENIGDEIEAAINSHESAADTVEFRSLVEALAEDCLASKGFSVAIFWQLLDAADMSFDDLYTAYIGKNVLNFFRQDHGYKDGSYVKSWEGREDNEHLVELLENLDSSRPDFRDALYDALAERYQSIAVLA